MEIDPILYAAVGGLVLFIVEFLKRVEFITSKKLYGVASVATGIIIALGYGSLFNPGYALLDGAKIGWLFFQGALIGATASGIYSIAKTTISPK